jgi:CHAT domain-containing protein/tetratricopeptide (TPR) repeat protein
MLRMPMLALLGLSLTCLVWADDPRPKAEPKPQWQRLLTGDDAKKANELAQQVILLSYKDQFAEAIEAAEEFVALRTKLQGADHWQVAKAKSWLAAMRKIAALPQEKRAGWPKSLQARVQAQKLQQQGQFATALPLWQQRLEWYREALGEDDRLTAEAYNDVALNLRAQQKYADAAPLLRKALDAWKALGEDHPDTASGYYNLARNLGDLAQYEEADRYYRKSLDIRRRVLGEGDANTAQGYHDLALNLDDQGRHAEAAPLHQKALGIYRQALGEEHLDTANAYNSTANNLQNQGKHAEAGPLFQKALDIRRKLLGEDHPDTALVYNNIANGLLSQGKYAEAEVFFRKGLDIYRKTVGEDNNRTALFYNNVASSLDAQRKYAEAGPLYEKALAIDSKLLGEDHPDTALVYNNIASHLHAQGKYADAGPLFQKALDIWRKALGENHPRTAIGYNNVAGNLADQGRFAEAGPLFRKALDIRRMALGEAHPATDESYSNVAGGLWAQGQYAEALGYREKSARSFEMARLGMASRGMDRATYGAKRSPYDFLAAARARAGRSAEAWAALEADLGCGLRDEMADQRGASLTPAELRQRDELRTSRAALEARVLALVARPARTDAESAELAQLTGERQRMEESLAVLAAAVGRRERATLEQLRAALPADAAFVAWVDSSDRSGAWVHEHWGCVVRPKGEPKWERLPGTGPDHKWTKDDTDLPAQLRTALAKSAPAAEVESLAKKLDDQRLAPLAKHLTGVKRLFVAPVHEMAGIPVEALTDQYAVSYTPSGTFLARLKDRQRPSTTDMLAVGDPVLPPAKEAAPPTALPPGGLLIAQVVPGSTAAKGELQAGDVLVAYAGEDLTSLDQLGKLVAAKAGEKSVVVKVWREGQEKLAERELLPGRLGVVLAKEPAREAITARRQADQILAKVSRGKDYAELPGAQVEIARLAALFDAKYVKTLTRAYASEERLDELRKAGELRKYRYLHLATHGEADNVHAFQSALILTKPTKEPQVREGEPYLDGRLTAAEVLEHWQLDAELVTLSACESGLGRKGGGDGLLGFAQAFLLAGSRSVCLSLWQVDDTATALLMDRFYRNLLGKREDGAKALPKAEALREAKQWLRNLTATEALERLGKLTDGVVRGKRPVLQEMREVPKPKDAAKDYKPYAHPRYWAAFILIGDPE